MAITDRISEREIPARRKSRVLTWVLRSLLALLGVLVVAGIAAGLWARAQLAGSLPMLAGEHAVRGLAAPVTIERDALGIPTLRGASRLDVARATGFIHAQERFFQMDFLRRQAAGELAELVGKGLLRLDRKLRVHRFRAEARQGLAGASPATRSLIEAYAQGVNEGLAALEKRPFEYLVLGAEPAPWKPEDTVLVQLSLFISLQDEDGEYESMLGLMQETLPPELFRFLTPRGTEWDAPLLGPGTPPVPLPGPEVLDLRKGTPLPRAASLGRRATAPEGEGASNAWALAGRHTADGRPLLAADMHLGLSVPGLWYRAVFVWPDPAGREHRVAGVTVPGVPLTVVGSNGSIAWGFTNSRIDTSDLVVLEPAPRDAEAYLTPSGPARYRRFREELRIRGEDAPEILDVRWTEWGPVLGNDAAGRPRALRWVAHDPAAVDLELGGLESARSTAEALAVAQRSGIPAQNFLVVDAAGHIAWTIAGRIPRREGFDGRLPVSWADGSRRWNGFLAGEEIPRLVDPADGRLWSANQRMLDGEALARLGDGNYVLGARARQIRDRLRVAEQATPGDMLALQLDDRALFLERWRKLLLDLLSPGALAADPRRRELREHVERWGGRAAVDSVGYRAVKEFREEVARQALGFLTAECARRDPEFDYADEHKQVEAPLWALVTQRPPHLLDPRYRTWENLLLAAADVVITPPTEEDDAPLPLARRTWGQRNTTAIGHLFSAAIPGGRRWLNMPAEPLPGDEDMPRVQRPSYGASQRMVVSPGTEGAGIFHMPGGQSGHPLSPHYDDAHAAWARGEASPFLPGATVDRLTLVPPR